MAISTKMKSSIVLGLQLYLIVVIKANERPRNTLTKSGQPTILICCSSHANTELFWLFKKWNTDEVNRVCDKQMCTDKYSLDKNANCLNLVIDSTTAEYAGLYQCVEERAEGITTGAYLVVYYNFTCCVNASENTDLVEDDHVIFHCSVVWIGKLPFEIRWGRDRIINKTVFSEQQKQNIYTASLNVVIKPPALRPHTATVVYRNEGTSDENIDTSTPNTNWTSPKFLVMYPVSDIRTTCHKDDDCRARPGDSMKCSADGHPTPDFRWLDWDKKLVSSNATLYVNFSGSHKFYCIATNTIRGIEYEQKQSVVLTVNTETTPSCAEEGMSRDSIIIIVIASVLVVVGLLLVGALVAFLVAIVPTLTIMKRLLDVVNNVDPVDCDQRRDEKKMDNGVKYLQEDGVETERLPLNVVKETEEDIPYSIETTS